MKTRKSIYANLVTALILLSAQIMFSQAPEVQWQNTIGGNKWDYLFSVHQTTDGGYILGGESKSNISGDKTESNVGSDDYWVVKINSDGLIDWQNTIGGSSWDYLRSIQQTADGGYIIAGFSNSGISGDKTEASLGLGDYWVLKLNSSGLIEWQNTIGGSITDYLYSIQQTADGGYILGGYSNSGISGDKTEASLGGYDYWVLKLGISGTIEWQNTVGGNENDQLSSIQQTADGGYILGGYSYSGISGDKTELSMGNADYWVVKLNSSGIIEWQNTIGGTSEDYLNSIDQTTDGGYILGGYSFSGISGDKTEALLGGYDYWVLKLNSSGAIEWQNTLGGNDNDQLNAVQQTADDQYILAGTSFSGVSGDKTEASLGYADYWVVKLNSSGIIEWQNTIGGGNGDWLYSVEQTTDGGYILGGYSDSGMSGDKTEASLGDFDYWVVHLAGTETTCAVPTDLGSVALSTKAKVNWEPVPDALTYRIRYRSGEAEPWQFKIAYAGKTSIVLKPLLCNTTYEWQIMSICSEVDSLHSEYSSSDWFTTAACRIGEEEDMFAVYPNPVQKTMYINTSTDWSGPVTLRLIDLHGKILQQVDVDISEEDPIEWTVSGFPSGIYCIQMLAGTNAHSESIIIIEQ